MQIFNDQITRWFKVVGGRSQWRAQLFFVEKKNIIFHVPWSISGIRRTPLSTYYFIIYTCWSNTRYHNLIDWTTPNLTEDILRNVTEMIHIIWITWSFCEIKLFFFFLIGIIYIIMYSYIKEPNQFFLDFWNRIVYQFRFVRKMLLGLRVNDLVCPSSLRDWYHPTPTDTVIGTSLGTRWNKLRVEFVPVKRVKIRGKP